MNVHVSVCLHISVHACMYASICVQNACIMCAYTYLRVRVYVCVHAGLLGSRLASTSCQWVGGGGMTA